MHARHPRALRRLPTRLAAWTAAAAFAAASGLVAAAPASAATPAEAWGDLEGRLGALIADAEADGVRMGVSVQDLSGSYGGAAVSVGSQEPYKAASVIKLPLLALLMDLADAGSLTLDESVTIAAGDPNIVGGSGTLRERPFPVDITVRELMELMVQVSDNTATNVLIDRAGGFDAVNEYIASLGFTDMWLGRKMIHPASPPLQENWLNADEVTELISMIYRHDILSPQSSEHILDLMRGQLVNTKFGAVIPRSVLGNKTGELSDVSHDSGVIFIPGREVALTATTAFDSTRPRTEVDLYVQHAASIVYEFIQEPLDEPVVIPDPTIPSTDSWPELAGAIDAIISEARAAGVELGVAISDLSGYYDDRSLYLGKLDRFTTASTIKMSLAATVMNQVQSGALSLDDVYTITEAERVGGSGVLRERQFPLEVTVGEMLELMITVSDNTATNKLVDVVGGFDSINQLTQSAGISMGDLHFGRKMFGAVVPPTGDIWLTPYGVDQLLRLFYGIAEGALVDDDFLSAQSAQRIVGLMRLQQVKTKLGAVIPADVLAHKTGENAEVSHDIGLMLLPGQEVSLSVFSTRGAGFAGDIQVVANPYLQRIGSVVYEYIVDTAPRVQPPFDPSAPGIETGSGAEPGTGAAGSSDGTGDAASRLASTGPGWSAPGLVTLAGAAALAVAAGALVLTARRRSAG